jgi:uncharacterized repeat protein (TIGR01451 family)
MILIQHRQGVSLTLRIGFCTLCLAASSVQAQIIRNGDFNDPSGSGVTDCINGGGQRATAPTPWSIQSTPDVSTQATVQFDGTGVVRANLSPGFDISPDGGCFQGFRSLDNATNEGVFQTTNPIQDASREHAFSFQYTEYTQPNNPQCVPQVEFRINSTDDSNGTALSSAPNVGTPGGPSAEGEWITTATTSFIPANFGINNGDSINIYLGVVANDCSTTWGFVDGLSLNPLPDLSKSLNPSTIIDGSSATYTWTIDNTQLNSTTAAGISFTDSLPGSIIVANPPNAITTCGGSISAVAGSNSVSVNSLSVASNSSCTVSVDVTNVSGNLNASCATNPVAFTNTSGNITALLGAINTLTPQCLVVNANIPVADISTTKTLDSSGPFTVGDTLQYTLVVSNTGPDTATNVTVDDIPSNLVINSVSSPNCSSFPCTIPSLSNGATETITVQTTIQNSGPFDNIATASADESDPNTSNNTDNTGNGGTAAPAADVSITKTLDTAGPFTVGDSFQYTLVVTNAGPDDATNVSINDTPTNLIIDSVSSTNCSAFPCTIPSLSNGASETITVQATIDNSGPFDNEATATAVESDPNTGNNTDNTGNGGTAAPAADVSITKTLDTAGPFTVGDAIQYTLVVTNAGPDDATNVSINDTPTNLIIDSVSSTNCSAFPCTIPSLSNGASETITVQATIDNSGPFDNEATATAVESDPDTGNNTDDSGNGGNGAPAADISVVKTLDSPGPFNVGDIVEYSLVVSNFGPDPATNVIVTDTPSQLIITEVSGAGCTSFPCTIGTLNVGDNAVITVLAQIDNSGVFDNVATVSAVETDPDPSDNNDDTDNSAEATFVVVEVPANSAWALWVLILCLMLVAYRRGFKLH